MELQDRLEGVRTLGTPRGKLQGRKDTTGKVWGEASWEGFRQNWEERMSGGRLEVRPGCLGRPSDLSSHRALGGFEERSGPEQAQDWDGERLGRRREAVAKALRDDGL